LLQNESLTEPAQELLGEMKGAVGWIAKTIEAIQQVARGEADNYRQTVVYLSEVMRRIQTRVTKRFPELVLEIDGEIAGVRLQLPEVKLYSILTNLIDNAAAACQGQSQGRVKVSFRRQENRLQVSIEDNGPGIPPEQREDLFKPLRRGKDSSGTGLGLSIVKAFVTEEGGTIVYDHSYTAGTRFLLDLPISTASEERHD